MPHLIREGLWRRIQGIGLERFELLQTADGWTLRGTIVVALEDKCAEARYEVVCDDSWHTKHADISLRDGKGERLLRVAVENGQWYENGHLNNAVTGCTDIDLEWTPSTNTLPIRRLQLAVGERSGPVTAAWVRFPELTLQPLRQEYQRTSEKCYRYSSREGRFVADITVDDEGLALDYKGGWERICRGTGG